MRIRPNRLTEHVGEDSPGLAETERELALRARSGDNQALGKLYDLYYDRVFRYALARLGNPADAEDAAEETFVKVVQAIGRYEVREGVPFGAWLFRIARNEVALHFRRRRGREPAEPLEEAFHAAAGDPEADVERKLLLEQVREAIARLPEAQQQVIALRLGAGLSTAEIAQVLGKREGNVRVLQHLALSRLRALLNEERT